MCESTSASADVPSVAIITTGQKDWRELMMGTSCDNMLTYPLLSFILLFYDITQYIFKSGCKVKNMTSVTKSITGVFQMYFP